MIPIEGPLFAGAIIFASALWGYIGYLRGTNKGYRLGENHGTISGTRDGVRTGFTNAVNQWNKQLGKPTRGQSLKKNLTKKELVKEIRTALGDDWKEGGVLVVSLPDNFVMNFPGEFPQSEGLVVE